MVATFVSLHVFTDVVTKIKFRLGQKCSYVIIIIIIVIIIITTTIAIIIIILLLLLCVKNTYSSTQIKNKITNVFAWIFEALHCVVV